MSRERDFTPDPRRVDHDHSSHLDLATMFRRPDKIKDPLYVVTTVFNSPRYRSRWKLYQDFARNVELNPAAELYTVEVAFGDREFAVTRPDNPRHLQLRTKHELFLKERSLNLLVQRLPHDWKRLAWIDADIAFARYDWADQIRHDLEHHPILQPWTHAIDLNVDSQPIQEHQSFAFSLAQGKQKPREAYYYPVQKERVIHFHPGYGWATRREIWDQLGGLLDVPILGAADAHMAWALIGEVDRTLPNGLHPRYVELIHAWQDRALAACRKDLGYTKGLILHYWHGSKTERKYATRGRILIDHQFNPADDLLVDYQGLWQLTHRNPALRRAVRQYFHGRDEDATR